MIIKPGTLSHTDIINSQSTNSGRVNPPPHSQQACEAAHLAEPPNLLAARLHLPPVVIVDPGLPLVVRALCGTMWIMCGYRTSHTPRPDSPAPR